MRKSLMAMAVVASAAMAAVSSFADGEEASAQSVNAVGVVKYTIPAGGELVCITLPLHPLETSDAEGRWVWGETTLADQLAKGSTVYFWTGTAWANYTKNALTGKWTAAVTNRPVQPGEAIFVCGPAKATEPQTISLLGELPTEDDLSYTVTGSKNLDTRGVTMYPVETVFGESELAEALPKGSSVYFWTGTAWANYTKNALTGKWTAAVTNRPVAVGEGIFVRSAGTADTITNVRPFAW